MELWLQRFSQYCLMMFKLFSCNDRSYKNMWINNPTSSVMTLYLLLCFFRTSWSRCLSVTSRSSPLCWTPGCLTLCSQCQSRPGKNATTLSSCSSVMMSGWGQTGRDGCHHDSYQAKAKGKWFSNFFFVFLQADYVEKHLSLALARQGQNSGIKYCKISVSIHFNLY